MQRRGVMRAYLFSDLRGYTVFVETHGDSATAKLLERYRRIVRAEVAGHAGAEIKTEGDSFYVVFSTAGDAVRAARGIIRRVRAHNARHSDRPIEVGIGINAGEAVEHDGGFVGSAVILASRLKDQAKAGQILITGAVHEMVRTAAIAPMRDLGAWRLKHVTDPVRVYEVETGRATGARSQIGPALRLPAMLATPGGYAPGLVVSPELVQRDRQLAVLLEHLAAASAGETRLVAITGEGGIGKSRLCRELARLAHEAGFTVLGGRSHATVALPYEPFVAALRPYAHARGPDILRRLLGTLALELRRLLPELDVSTPSEAMIPEDERRDRFLRTIQLLLEDAAAQQPVLLVLEDFHEADAGSVELLGLLAVALRAGVCIALTLREDEVPAGGPVRALLGDLDRERRLARIALGPLDLDGVARMTDLLRPGGDGHGLARAVFERSEGVPFYVEELLKAVVDAPDASAVELALPRTVRDSVLLRLSRLAAARGDHCRELLELVAVAGLPLAHEALLGLSGRAERDTLADVEAAVQAQLLEPLARTDTYQFRHALTRDAVLEHVPMARRPGLHRRVAETLEALGAAAPGPATLALHFAAAGDRARALHYARAAATSAVAVGAYAAAIGLLRTAAASAAGTPEEAEIDEQLGAALQAAGHASEAERALLRARELVEDAQDLARLDLRLAAVLRMQGQRAAARAAAARAAATAAGSDGMLLAEALVRQADLAWAESDPFETARLADEALAVARSEGATGVEIEALTLLGAAATRLGRADGPEHLAAAVRAADGSGRGPEAMNAHLELARGLLFLGRNDDALVSARAALDLAREQGLEFAQARILAFATTICVNLGKYEEARGYAEQAVALARPDTVAASAARMALAHVMSDQGAYAEALALYERIEADAEHDDPDRRTIYWSYRSQTLLALGRYEEAAAAARKAVDLTVAIPSQGMTAFLNAAEVAEARRDAEGIRALAARFATYFAGRDTAPIRLTRLELEAIAALCEGRDAAERFDAVADAYEGLDARVRTAYRRGTAAALRLRDPGTRGAARRELSARRTELAGYGAARYVAALDVALERRSTERAPRGILGRQELQVAMLLSRGFTDHGIAAELRVSRERASTLVRAVLARLGVTTRSQVAGWVVSREAGRAVAEAR